MMSRGQYSTLLRRVLTAHRRHQCTLKRLHGVLYRQYGGIGPDFDVESVIENIDPGKPETIVDQADRVVKDILNDKAAHE